MEIGKAIFFGECRASLERGNKRSEPLSCPEFLSGYPCGAMRKSQREHGNFTQLRRYGSQFWKTEVARVGREGVW